jgi:redox-regulated HSP33 family molecular chaperone
MADKSDRLIRFLLPGALARGAIIRAEHIIEGALAIHGLNGAVGEIFGKALVASILLLSISKGGVRQVLQLDARDDQPQAPVRRILSESRPGMVRGYLNWGESGATSRSDAGNSLSAWMGKPVRTSVVRDLGFGHPYLSTIEHDSDYLADHMLHFLTQSAQVQSDIILHGNIGLMIEAMPGCDEEHWFKAVEALASISNKQLASESPENLLHAFDALGCKVVSDEPYSYHCSCNPEMMAAALKSIDTEELHELADESGKVTLSCQYCNRTYEIGINSLDSI